MGADERVLIQRLDSGRSREPGNYRCTECEWEGTSIRFQAAYEHGPKHHLGRSVTVVRMVPRPRKTYEELMETRRRLDRKYYHRKKVRESRLLGCSLTQRDVAGTGL